MVFVSVGTRTYALTHVHTHTSTSFVERIQHVHLICDSRGDWLHESSHAVDKGQDRLTRHCELIGPYLSPSSQESLEVVEYLISGVGGCEICTEEKEEIVVGREGWREREGQ